jgi:hypothetical protein
MVQFFSSKYASPRSALSDGCLILDRIRRRVPTTEPMDTFAPGGVYECAEEGGRETHSIRGFQYDLVSI